MHDSKNQLSVQNLIVSLADQFQSIAQRDESQREGGLGSKEGEGELGVFTSAFWETISREWAGVDRLRMDKVLLLVRMAVRQLFQLCISASSDPDQARIKEQIDIFETWPLSPRDRTVPDGVRYHVLDIWVDELARCKQATNSAEAVAGNDGETADEYEDEGGELKTRVKMLMGPVNKIAKDGLNKSVRTRAKDTLLDARERLGVGG
jgi:ribosomal RNA-processing protein 1